jgi:hypothetical protein
MKIDVISEKRKQLKGSLKIALVVGTILSIVNQYEVIIYGELGLKEVIKIIMNFIVPFSVASYSKFQFKKSLNKKNT